MGISASKFSGSLDFDDRVSLIVDATGDRYVTKHEAPLMLSSANPRHDFWAREVRRGVVDAWLFYERRNDLGTAGLSVVLASDHDMTTDVIEFGPVFIPPSAPNGSIRLPIDLGAMARFDNGDLYAAVKFTMDGGAEIGLTMAFLSRKRP